MKIAFIILNYKTYEMTLALIRQIHDCVKNIEYEIIVVDNASPNDSAEQLENSPERFIFLKSITNGGYASGNNIGIRHAINKNYTYALIMNNDIEIPTEAVIAKMADMMESNPSIAAVSPRIIDGKGKHDPPIYYKKPSFWDLTFGMISYQKGRFQFDEKQNVRVYAPRGSFMLLRCSALEEINLLDEETFLYYEEPILAERLIKNNYECWHCGEAEVIHNHAVTISKTFNKKNMARLVCKSYRYYLRQYRGFSFFARNFCVAIRYFAIMMRR